MLFETYEEMIERMKRMGLSSLRRKKKNEQEAYVLQEIILKVPQVQELETAYELQQIKLQELEAAEELEQIKHRQLEQFEEQKEYEELIPILRYQPLGLIVYVTI